MAQFVLDESTVLDEERTPSRRTEFKKIPEDVVLDAVVDKVEVGEHKFFKDENGNPQKKVFFTFVLKGDEYGKNRKLWGETSTTFSRHPDCKLRAWTQEILGGGELQKEFKLDTDALEGADVRVLVGYEEWESKKNPGTKDWKNTVKDVIHARGAGGSSYIESF